MAHDCPRCGEPCRCDGCEIVQPAPLVCYCDCADPDDADDDYENDEEEDLEGDLDDLDDEFEDPFEDA